MKGKLLDLLDSIGLDNTAIWLQMLTCFLQEKGTMIPKVIQRSLGPPPSQFQRVGPPPRFQQAEQPPARAFGVGLPPRSGWNKTRELFPRAMRQAMRQSNEPKRIIFAPQNLMEFALLGFSLTEDLPPLSDFSHLEREHLSYIVPLLYAGST